MAKWPDTKKKNHMHTQWEENGGAKNTQGNDGMGMFLVLCFVACSHVIISLLSHLSIRISTCPQKPPQKTDLMVYKLREHRNKVLATSYLSMPMCYIHFFSNWNVKMTISLSVTCNLVSCIKFSKMF